MGRYGVGGGQMCKERASKYRPQANKTLIGIFVKIVKHVLTQYFMNMTHCLLRKLYVTRPQKYVFTPAAKPIPTHKPPTHHLTPIQCRDASPRSLRGSRDPRLRARVRMFSHCGLLQVCVCVALMAYTSSLPAGGMDSCGRRLHRQNTSPIISAPIQLL